MTKLDFASWDYGLRQEELEHHGIPGMSWGTRRYQNEDGSLTPLGREHYGYGPGEGTRRVSAKKMQKDFNDLDQGYANVVADQQRYARKTAKLSRKANKAGRRGNEAKKLKLLAKALKYGQKAALSNKQKKAIEQLQWKIIGKAATEGYTTTSTPVKRVGLNKIGRIGRAIPVATGGGVIPSVVSGGMMGKNSVSVDGQKVRISKRGNGGTHIVNYANANKIAADEREQERRRKLAGVNRG